MSRELQQHFAQLLTDEQLLADQLLQLLQQEHEALVQDDADRILAIAAQKQQLAARLQGQSAIRDQLLQQCDLPAGKQGTDALLSNGGSEVPHLQRLWQLLQERFVEMKQQNEINGGIVALSQNHLRQALDILTGQCEQQSAYGRSGNHLPRSSRSLARA